MKIIPTFNNLHICTFKAIFVIGNFVFLLDFMLWFLEISIKLEFVIMEGMLP